jgi:oligopeptide transport system substrate-binding protein
MIFRRETRARKHRRILTILSGKDGKSGWWNRRLALLGGGALGLGAGAYVALRPSQAPRRAQVAAGTLRRGNGAEPETLDPALSAAVWEDAIIGDLIVGLLTEDIDGKPIPGMAESWTTSPDGLTWTFKLRQASWSDGVPVTAEDFVFAWRRLLDPATAARYAYFIYVVKNAEAVNARKLPSTTLGIRAVDARTLEVTLEHPAPYLPEMLTHTSTMPVPRHVVQAKGKSWAQPGNYVGNGPYVLTEWRPNDHITLVKNPRFYEAEKVTVERILLYPTVDYPAALRSLRAGELDVQDRLPAQQIDWIRKNMPELINPVPQLTLDFLVVNHTLPQFQDVRVRKAMNLLINREAITDKIIRTGQVPAYNLVPPSIANYPGGVVLDVKAVPEKAHLEQAQALMRAAGYGPDRPLHATFLLRSSGAGVYRATGAALQQMFALGWINITVVNNDPQIFYNRLEVQDFEIANAGWGADFNDASNFLDILKSGKAVVNNWGKYSNPAFDAALAAAQREVDIVKRGEMLVQAERIALDDHAVMPLFFWVSGNLVRPYLKGWKSNALDKHRTRWMTIDEDARRRTLASV